MLAAVGHPVTRLHRVRYAGLTVDGLEPGGLARAEPAEHARAPGARDVCGPSEEGRRHFVAPSRTAYVIAASAADWTISACACAIQAWPDSC